MSHCTLIVANAGGRRCTWLTRMTRSVRSETNFSYSTVFLVSFRYTSLTCKKKTKENPSSNGYVSRFLSFFWGFND